MSEPVQKREYNPPGVLRIELEAEEVLAIGCKNDSTSTRAAGGLMRPCRIAQACGTPGS